jgi:hypothetical protein
MRFAYRLSDNRFRGRSTLQLQIQAAASMP